jgi:hypothetical protein
VSHWIDYHCSKEVHSRAVDTAGVWTTGEGMAVGTGLKIFKKRACCPSRSFLVSMRNPPLPAPATTSHVVTMKAFVTGKRVGWVDVAVGALGEARTRQQHLKKKN